MSVKIRVSYRAGRSDPAALSAWGELEAAAEKGALHEGVQCHEA